MSSKIWEKIITPEEKIEFEFTLGKKYLDSIKYAWLSLALFIFFVSISFSKNPSQIFNFIGNLFFILGWILVVISFSCPWYLKRSNNFAFTNKRVLILRGWLSTHLISIDFEKITDIKVEEKFFEKTVFDTGTLIIDTAGTHFPEVIISHIANPYMIKTKLDEIRGKIP